MFLAFNNKAQQIANYVNNGGFEICGNCPNYTPVLNAKYWNGIDTTIWYGLLLSRLAPSFQVPLSSYTYQWPRHGNNYLLSSLFIQPGSNSIRGYPRNKLKQTLQSGKTYCVKFYYSVTNESTYGIDGIGAYFGDSSTDTISQCDKPITYLNPQVQNPINNIISDTLNWVLITGTFVATGSEKYMILGNFKSDAATNSLIINPTNLPTIATEVLYDDVSCIDIDLPAYAGPDLWCIPGDSVFIGRQPDVGIDEDCLWYKLPNTTTAIDTVAGLWVSPIVTTTYVVKQDICGNVKWDTVVVFQSATGINEIGMINYELSVYPNPANEEIEIYLKSDIPFTKPQEVKMLDVLGREVKSISLLNEKQKVNISELLPGCYYLQFKNEKGFSLIKKIIKN